ncbi:hypothetical protein [Enterococcus innesii]|nr:hypothetical protein [Enterococcus innesii]
MRHDFFTYADFEKEIAKYPNFSFEYMANKLQIFYDFLDKGFDRDTNYMRQPIFTIDLNRAFDLVTPYGYRLTALKRAADYNHVSDIVLKLSNTPIYYRKEGG